MRLSTKEVWIEVQKRIVKSFLDILILAQLRKEPKSAYDFIAFIHKKFHILISSGTVYSTVYSLEREGLTQGHFDKRKKVYTITDKGKKTLQAFLKANEKIQVIVTNLLGDLSE